MDVKPEGAGHMSARVTLLRVTWGGSIYYRCLNKLRLAFGPPASPQ